MPILKAFCPVAGTMVFRYRTVFNFMLLCMFLARYTILSVTASSAISYLNSWAVQVQGGSHVAETLAQKHGFLFKGKIFDDFYLFEHKRVAKRSAERSETSGALSLENEMQVSWLMQQREKKRELYSTTTSATGFDRRIMLDMNIESAWKRGYNGRNVKISVVDDGLFYNHPSLRPNYNRDNSFDVVSDDYDPSPRNWQNGHGTKSAGVIAGVKERYSCRRGVASDARISGIRLFGNRMTTDQQEARALSYNHESTDIYSCSWGPSDTGWNVDGPGPLTKQAIKKGATKGRHGLGSIYMFAAGNGGINYDSCAYNGFANSIYTVTINGANEDGSVPRYAEPCSATLASAYSLDNTKGRENKEFKTTDTWNICSSKFGGTSLANSVASGIVAIALDTAHENRLNLTWRDIQHLIVRTSRSQYLCSEDWKTNGAGLNVSSYFGFGLLDADALARMAARWISVPQQNSCQLSVNLTNQMKFIPATVPRIIQLNVTETNCPGVNFLEHVQLRVSLEFTRRGYLEIDLVSPSNTIVKILPSRQNDVLASNLSNWELLSMQFWGETPKGTWYINMTNKYPEAGYNKGVIDQLTLTLYGTKKNPLTKQNKENLQSVLRSREKRPLRRCVKDSNKHGESTQKEIPECQSAASYTKREHRRMTRPFLKDYFWPHDDCKGCVKLCTRDSRCLSASCLPAWGWKAGKCQLSAHNGKIASNKLKRDWYWEYFEKNCFAPTTILPTSEAIPVKPDSHNTEIKPNRTSASRTVPPTTQRLPVSPKIVQPEYTCHSEPVWFKFGTSCYKINHRTTTRQQAQRICANERGHLVMITSLEENKFLTEKIERTSQHWIGLKRNSWGTFVWDSTHGEHIDFEYWSPYEPNNSGGTEDCAQISGGQGLWNDVSCHVRHSFICERDAERVTMASQSSTADTPLVIVKKAHFND